MARSNYARCHRPSTTINQSESGWSACRQGGSGNKHLTAAFWVHTRGLSFCRQHMGEAGNFWKPRETNIEPNLTEWNQSRAVRLLEHGDQLPSFFLRRVRDQIELQPALAPA